METCTHIVTLWVSTEHRGVCTVQVCVRVCERERLCVWSPHLSMVVPVVTSLLSTLPRGCGLASSALTRTCRSLTNSGLHLFRALFMQLWVFLHQ